MLFVLYDLYRNGCSLTIRQYHRRKNKVPECESTQGVELQKFESFKCPFYFVSILALLNILFARQIYLLISLYAWKSERHIELSAREGMYESVCFVWSFCTIRCIQSNRKPRLYSLLWVVEEIGIQSSSAQLLRFNPCLSIIFKRTLSPLKCIYILTRSHLSCYRIS